MKTLSKPSLLVMGLLLASCTAISPSIQSGDSSQYSVVEVSPQVLGQLQGKQAESNRARPTGDTSGASYRYIIGVGDVLVSRFYMAGSDELSYRNQSLNDTIFEGHQTVVKDDGMASFPYAGEVRLAGKTLPQAKAALNAALRKYYRNPQVTLDVKEYRSSKVQLTGQIKTPGELYLQQSPTNVLQALQKAGGPLDDADLANAQLTRKNGRTQNIDLFALMNGGDANQNLVLLDGDTLHLPAGTGNKVFVMGEVTKPSSLYIKGGRMTVMEALNSSQGLNPNTASYQKVYVLRGEMKAPAAAPAPAPVATPVAATTTTTSVRSHGTTLSTKHDAAAAAAPAPAPAPLAPAAAPAPVADSMHTTIYLIDASSGPGIAMAAQFPLRPNDVVYVSPTAISEWSKIISQILPANGASLNATRVW